MRFKSNIKGRKGLRKTAQLADWREIRKVCRDMDSFNCIEMTEIYRGCREKLDMPPETIDSLTKRLALCSSKPLNK
jgi:hypothetical protein